MHINVYYNTIRQTEKGNKMIKAHNVTLDTNEVKTFKQNSLIPLSAFLNRKLTEFNAIGVVNSMTIEKADELMSKIDDAIAKLDANQVAS